MVYVTVLSTYRHAAFSTSFSTIISTAVMLCELLTLLLGLYISTPPWATSAAFSKPSGQMMKKGTSNEEDRQAWIRFVNQIDWVR